MIARVDSKDSGKVIEEKIKTRLIKLNLKKELLKIQVKYREERSFTNVVDIVTRNIDEEIKLMASKII